VDGEGVVVGEGLDGALGLGCHAADLIVRVAGKKADGCVGEAVEGVVGEGAATLRDVGILYHGGDHFHGLLTPFRGYFARNGFGRAPDEVNVK
jgi:hypothetical protein